MAKKVKQLKLGKLQEKATELHNTDKRRFIEQEFKSGQWVNVGYRYEE